MPPHLRIPFAISSDGSALTVEQGTDAEIVQSVSNLIGTTPGTRYLSPTYGMPDPTFAGVDPVVLRHAVQKWEPRATVSVNTGPPVVVSVGVA